MNGVTNLDQYMERYGLLLGKQAAVSLEPLHVPGRDALTPHGLNREPFEPQDHAIEAVAKAWKRQKSAMLIGECGTGKTLMGIGAVHRHAAGAAYNALVFCPGTLVNKWEREIRETIHGARVVQLEDWKDVLAIERGKPTGPTWYVIARDRAKLGAKWRPAYRKVEGQPHLRCPDCGGLLVTDRSAILMPGELAKKKQWCMWVLDPKGGPPQPGCHQRHKERGALWQYSGELRRWEPAQYIHKHLKGFFDYLVLDEMHEEKSATSAQGNAAGSLAAACRKVLAMTGTLIGGYAEHIRPLLFRLSPRSLVQEGLSWSQSMRFNELYGRIETTVRETSSEGSGGGDNVMSRGSTSKSKTKAVKPGIMPTLFGRHLLGQTVFLTLDDVAENLPDLEEVICPVGLGQHLSQHYRPIEKKLTEAVQWMLRNSGGGDKRLLGTMLQALLCYPDYPFNWDALGYWDKGMTPEGEGRGNFITVCIPDNLEHTTVYPKEAELIKIVREESAAGRQCWVYIQYTERHDVQDRLANILEKEGFKVASLRASVKPAEREQWITKHAPGKDVVICHPKLVETGLDLFDKAGKHNFCSLIFYETGYNLFTLRQAARRSWRLGQHKECRVYYLYYADTMQERAMTLMGEKLTAAENLEGKFSEEGLVAMANQDGGSVEMALARSLDKRLDKGAALRAWKKVAPPVILQMPKPQPSKWLAQLSREERLARLRARLAKPPETA